MERAKDTVRRAVKGAFRVLVTNNLDIMREEALEIKRFAGMLRSYWRPGIVASKEELREMKIHVLNITKGVATMIVLLLPGGFLLLPLTGYFFRKKSGAA
jgi:hypothetical protein